MRFQKRNMYDVREKSTVDAGCENVFDLKLSFFFSAIPFLFDSEIIKKKRNKPLDEFWLDKTDESLA